MFFRKKQPKTPAQTGSDSTDASHANRRKHYRVPHGPTESIRVSLMRESMPPVGGDCVDLSIGGTVVEFDSTKSPNLAVGDTCLLRIRASSQTHVIDATSNRIELYAQLDEYYARLFNRRRQVRVIPGYDIRIPVTLTWKTGTLPTTVHDISEEGLGLRVPLEKAEPLARITSVDVSLRLPKKRSDLLFRATIKSRTHFAKTSLLGLEFSTEGDVQQQFKALRRFIQERLALIQAWNEKSGKRKAV